MALLNTIKHMKLTYKTISGYIKCMLTSDSIIMKSGKDLQTEINTINTKWTEQMSYNLDTPCVVGMRNNRPVYKIIKQYPSTSNNLSLNGFLSLKIPEVIGKQIISYHANMVAGYGCYELPFINDSGTLLTWVSRAYNVSAYTITYNNKGDNWDNWTLIVGVIYQ